MILLSMPSAENIKAFLDAQSRLNFTYTAVGATASLPPSCYNVDHSRIRLGEGEQTFQAATAALESWTQFRLGWVEAKPLEPSIRVDGMVAVVGRSMGLWWLNACRIIYVTDDDGPLRRFGFACGTMPAHVGTGEERFLIEWDRADDSVWYDILAFSKPHGVLARLGYPWMRVVQRRFRKQSASAMVQAMTTSTAQVSNSRTSA